MSLLSRRGPDPDEWVPPTRPDCSCPEHVDELRDLVVPLTEPDVEPMTAADLVESGGIGTTPAGPRDRWLEVYGEAADDRPTTTGPFHWGVWVGDEARLCYDDDAALPLDRALRDRPGVDLVEWMEREEFLVGAPTLCADGMLAAVVRALADPRVRHCSD